METSNQTAFFISPLKMICNPIRTVRQILHIMLVLLCFSTCSLGAGYSWEQDSRTWVDSRKRCENIGKQLVTIRNQEEYAAVVKYLKDIKASSDNIWIGLKLPSGTKNVADFRWMDGSELSWVKWDSGEPRKLGSQTCVALRYETTDKAYETRDCTDTFDCVCEDIRTKEDPLPASTALPALPALPGHPSSVFIKIQHSVFSPETPFDLRAGRSRTECAVRCMSAYQCYDFTFGNGVCSIYTAIGQAKQLCESNDCETYHRK